MFLNGTKETLTELRSCYWVVKGRRAVGQFIRHCYICRRIEAQAYRAPPLPPLPPFRVQEEPPFTYTGIDFNGPLYIKTTTTHPNASNKVWICLYTCCITRAIHLDLVSDLSSQSFLYSFKRFAAWLGLPRRIVSDNGKTFRSAAKTLKAIMSSREVTKHLAGLRVEWVFNIERAPWWGGIFERMVQSTKHCLRKVIGRARLKYEELLTVIIEVEAIVNSRPLSYVSPNDLEELLTPSHLLVGRRLTSLPDHTQYEQEPNEDFKTSPEILTRRMRFLNNVLQKFWKQWKREYLLEPRNKHRGKGHLSKDHGTVSKGDVVVVRDDKEK